MHKCVKRIFSTGAQVRSIEISSLTPLQGRSSPNAETSRVARDNVDLPLQKPQTDSKPNPLNWESIFQAIGSPTLILDTDFNILYANRAAVSATGKSAEQLQGKKCYTVFHSPAHKKHVKSCPMAKLLNTKTVQTKEMEVEALGDTYLVSCTPVLDENNNVSQIIHIATPITEHKRVTNELERQNRYQRQLNEFAIKLSHLGEDSNLEELVASELKKLSGALALTITDYDPKTKCLNVAKLYADSWILNQVNNLMDIEVEKIPSILSEEEYQTILAEQVGIKKTLYDATFGGVSMFISNLVSRIFRIKHYLGLAYVCDNRLYGTSLLAMQRGTPDPPFEILRTFGQLAALAMQRKRASEALKESEDKYLQLIETMSEGVVVVDNDDVIQFVNPAACEI